MGGGGVTEPKPKARYVSASIPPDLADWLKDQAAREQRTVGVVITRALQTYRQACEAEGLDSPENASALPIRREVPRGQTEPVA
jgi:hypothetical protein